jgi:hypothetical protein
MRQPSMKCARACGESRSRARQQQAETLGQFADADRFGGRDGQQRACVFLSFAVGDQRVLKFGLSLASAVFLDAFVVRSLLLPSVLEILGRRTSALPDWLGRRLPHLAIDRPETLVAPPAAKPVEQGA